MTAATLFLAMAFGSLGFSALRLSTRRGAKDVPAYAALSTPGVFRLGGSMLILLSCLPLLAGEWPLGITLTCWLFCIQPMSALPSILCAPFHSRRAVLAPALAFVTIGAALSLLRI